jgi:hypothetical protein
MKEAASMLSARETHALQLGYAPPKGPAPRPEASYVARLLDEAHHELAAHELASLLLSVHRAVSSPNGHDAPPPTGPSTPEGRRYLAVIETVLGAPRAPEELRGWLAEYVDDVAVRPKGAAPPLG